MFLTRVAVSPGLTDGVVLTALDPTDCAVEAVNPTEGVTLTAVDTTECVVLTAVDPTEGVVSMAVDPTEGAVLTAVDPPEGMVLTTLNPTDSVPMALRPTDSMPMSTDVYPTESMAFLRLTALDLTRPVEVGHLPVHLRPYYPNWGPSRVTATTSSLNQPQPPESRMTTTPSRRRASLPTTRSSPDLADQSCLPTRGLAEGRYLNLCPLAGYYVLAAGPQVMDESCPSLLNRGSSEEKHLNLAGYYELAAAAAAAAGPLALDESCPSLSTPGSSEEEHLNLAGYYVLAAAGPLAMGEGCPSLSTPGSPLEKHLNLAGYYVLAAAGPLAMGESCPSLSTPGSPEERHLNRGLATLGHAASAPVPTDSQSLTTADSAAISSCQRLLRSSTAHSMDSVMQLLHPLFLLHRHALRVSLVLIQGP